jgi:DNA invertase Pin-like site-specific DNA recombinase
MKPVRAAILVRISDDRAGEAAGVGRQEKDARALAERLGWQVGEVIIENDVSAFKRRTVTLPDGSAALRVVRPGFRRLLELLALEQVDGLIAYDLDRVARDPRDLEDLIDVVERTRVPVESVSGSLRLANDSDVTMARVMVAVANKSSRDSSRRISRKLEQLAQEGKYAGGGARCFGFEADGTTHNPAEADAIRWAAERIIAGTSISQTARDLDERGVATVRGGKWSSKALADILRGPRVAGLRVHRGEVVGKAVWEPILDRDTYDTVCAALHARAKGIAARPILKRWLNGVLFCGRCGEALVGQYVTRTRYRYWCSTTYDGCGGIGISGPGVEAEVERQILDYLGRSDVLASLAAATSPQGTERARADLADDESQLKVLARMWAAKQITLPEYAEARFVIQKRIEDARKVLSTSVPGRVRAVLASDDITASWAELDPSGRREVVLALVRGWRVHPADLTKPRRFDPTRLEVMPAVDGLTPERSAV